MWNSQVITVSYTHLAVLLCDGGDLRAPKRHAGTGRSYHAAHFEFA